jgi:hypothetical protein
MRFVPILGLMFGLLAGCAGFNSGKVDFRRADNLSAASTERLRTKHRSDCWKDVGEPKRVSPRPEFSDCAAMLPTSLSDKNYGNPADAIKVTDVYSIRLDFGRIQTLGERFGNVRVGSPRSGLFRQQGEIAALVNAFEFAPQGAETGTGGRFYNLGQNTIGTGAGSSQGAACSPSAPMAQKWGCELRSDLVSS